MILMMRLRKHYCQYIGFAQDSRRQHGEGYHELQSGLRINPEKFTVKFMLRPKRGTYLPVTCMVFDLRGDVV